MSDVMNTTPPPVAIPLKGGATRFALTSRWTLDAPPAAVWRLLTEVDRWPGWWPYVRRVERRHTAPTSPVGDVLRIAWGSALGYGLKLELETIAAERERLLEARTVGDLRGAGRWTLEAAEGGATRLVYVWQVELHRPWMRALAGLLRPVFAWNHFAVMRAGARGMANALGCEMRGLEEDLGAERR
jgi:uncharacterized protein YndB with AHSA1/START domain